MKLKKMLSAAAAIMAAVMMLSACGRGGDTSSAPQGAGGEGVSAEASQNTEESASSDNTAESKNSEVSEKTTSKNDSQTGDNSVSSNNEQSFLSDDDAFSSITPEQEKPIIEKEKELRGHLVYDRAVAVGLIDPEAPKLTMDDVNRILEDSKKLKNIMVRYEEYGQIIAMAQRRKYIWDEISKIQKYADLVDGSDGYATDLQYWVWQQEENHERKIMFVYSKPIGETYTIERDENDNILYDTITYVPELLGERPENYDTPKDELPFIKDGEYIMADDES